MIRAIKRLLQIKRYFIVSYNSKDSDTGRRIDGMIQFKTNGCYLNYLACADQIKEFIKENNSWEISQVVITMITEISRRDYKDWINKNAKGNRLV